MTVRILAGDNATRMIKGCNVFGLKFTFNKKTDPYIQIEINTEEDCELLFWLGANCATPPVETHLMKSRF